MSNMSADRSNRIQVDLQLLQDRNLTMLSDFATKFSDSVNKLDRLVKDGFGIKDAGPFAPVETSASTVERVREAVYGSRDIFPHETWQQPASPKQSESRAPQPNFESMDWQPRNAAGLALRVAMANSYANLPGVYGGNEYELAQFHLGSLQPGILSGLQYASYLTGNMANKNAWDENGNWIGTNRQQQLLMTSGKLGQVARRGVELKAIMPELWRTIGAIPGIGYMAQYGNPANMNIMAMQGVGMGNYDTAGWGGTPFMSGAWKSGMAQQWSIWKGSRWNTDLNWNPLKGFGIPGSLISNPNYTPAQRAEAEQLMTDYGWDNDLRDGGLDIMRRYTQKYRGAYSQQFMMELLDPIMRTGSGNVGQVSNILDSLAQSARAANVNLQKFAEQALSAGQAISSQTGMSLYRSTRAAGDIMGVTGLGAGAAEEIMTNDLYMYLGATNSPYGIAGMLYGEGAASRRFGAMMDVADPSRRGFSDPERWRGFKWGQDISQQSPEHIQLMNEFAWAQRAGMVPQNITMDEWINMMRRSLKTGKSVEETLNAQSTLNLAVDKSTQIATNREVLEKQAMKNGLEGISAEEWKGMPGWARDKFLDKISENRQYAAVGKGMKDSGYGEEWAAARELERMGVNLKDSGSLLELSDKERQRAMKLMKVVAPYQDLIKQRGGSIDNVEDARAFAEGIAKETWGEAGDQIAQNTVEVTVKQPYGEMFEAIIKKSKNTSSGNSSSFFGRAANAVNPFD